MNLTTFVTDLLKKDGIKKPSDLLIQDTLATLKDHIATQVLDKLPKQYREGFILMQATTDDSSLLERYAKEYLPDYDNILKKTIANFEKDYING